MEDIIFKHLNELMPFEQERLENLCRQAIILQDYSYLERLTIISFPASPEIPDTVASLL